ncbi:MAG: alpha-mannosidase [Fimbriimonadaceae bacterium]|nr:alpha-mannosidase [Fimbriimonadaceae bacterium]
MLKHSDLTITRVLRLIDNELKPNIYGESVPLTVEICDVPHTNEKDAKKGPFKTVEPGYKYGPAYTTFWFRVSGTVPKNWAGKLYGMRADLDTERTVWADNSPWLGLDSQHDVMPFSSDTYGPCPIDAQPGKKVTVYIQAYTPNPQCRVYVKELPREDLVSTVKSVDLVIINHDIKELLWDIDFCLNLVRKLPQDEPAFHTILRGLNDACNLFRLGSPETYGRCRKVLRDAMASLPESHKHTMTAVGHAHLDTAWLWPLDVTHKKMAHTAANQLALMARYPEYVFVHSQASQYEWVEMEYPVLFERIKEAIKKGQWEPLGSMWVEADCNLSGSEALVRQFLYGRRYFRDKLGYETQDMWLPDVFGYAASIPQILKKFNIDYFLTQKISWNQFNKFPHHTFWWHGIDGTEVWSHFLPADTYCASCEPENLLFNMKNYKDHARCDHSLYVYGYGDGGGGPTERHIEFLRRARTAPALPEINRGKKALDFFRDAKAKSKDLTHWHGELYLELHRGTYTSQAATKKGNRFSEFLLRDAELLSCFTPDFPKAYPQTEIEDAWKLTLLNQFHDILPGSSVNEVYRDAARDYAEIARVCNGLIGKALSKIGNKMDRSEMERPYAMFQNASVQSQGEIDWTSKDEPQSITTEDENLPVQVIEAFGERKLIFPTPMSALGAVAIADIREEASVSKYRLKASPRKLENGELLIRFDQHGNITSIQSLEDGTEFVEPGKLANMFQIFEDKPNFWSAWDVEVFSYETSRDLVKSESVEVAERGPVRCAIEVVKRFNKSTIRQRISLGPTPGIRFDTEVDWHEEDKMLKVAFPVNIHALRATYEIQFGNVERPTHYNTSWDMARFEVPAQKWVDLSEGDQGVALLNDCKYGHDINGNVMRMTLLRAPKAPDPECDMGKHRFTYVLMPHFGPYNYAGVVQASYALNAPLRSVALEPGAGADGNLPPLIQVDDRNVVVESVKKAEDSNDLIVRLYECHGSRGFADLFCARPIESAWMCDMEENNVEDIEVADGRVLFNYRPFEIITLKLRCP